MNGAGMVPPRTGMFASLASLLASSGTLVCCALPALLVTVGAGAALSSLVSAVPQLVWLSEHKGAVFTLAGVMLMASGGLQWRARTAPCPTDPSLRQACMLTRSASFALWLLSVAVCAVGAAFAFVLPWLTDR